MHYRIITQVQRKTNDSTSTQTRGLMETRTYFRITNITPYTKKINGRHNITHKHQTTSNTDRRHRTTLQHDERSPEPNPFTEKNHVREHIYTQNTENAHLAADLDNYKSALDRLNQNTPIAINTEDNVKRLKQLYPTKHIITEKTSEIHTSQKHTHQENIDLHTFCNIITRIPKGKAAGTLADISDVIRSLITHKDNHKNSFPYTKAIYKLFKIIIKGDIPTSIKNIIHPFLSSVYTKTQKTSPN